MRRDVSAKAVRLCRTSHPGRAPYYGRRCPI